ncbi:MAG TPA: DUF362 domain-containing protein [Longimicrobiales bacterium]|nr:DUF362 domain-containing protein [Longimicrobiales bacterium]
MADRRDFLRAAALLSLAPALSGCERPPRPLPPQPWTERAHRRQPRSATAILAAPAYDGTLVDLVRRGAELCDLEVRGRRVVLKPNFVEFDPGGAINTHPALITATIEAFRAMGAASVTVAEGPGHRRDTEYILSASGLDAVLRDTGARYVDLNVDRCRAFAAGSAYTSLERLYLPDTISGADLLVSMPKLKVHHWAGVTLSLKNMFGALPGAVYGWPKNVLHYAGLEQSILDINATLTVPRFNIVDGIIGMEGDGPIRGDARASGVLVFGRDPVAVDATAARLMQLEPRRVWYLLQAGRFLGNLEAEQIDQRGESIETFAQEYRLIDRLRYLRPSLHDVG